MHRTAYIKKEERDPSTNLNEFICMPVDAWERIYTYSKQFQESIHRENV